MNKLCDLVIKHLPSGSYDAIPVKELEKIPELKDPEIRVAVLNKLSNDKEIYFLTEGSNPLTREPLIRRRRIKVDSNDPDGEIKQQVYDLIENMGNKGICKVDIKKITKINPEKTNKAIKFLSDKKYIKGKILPKTKRKGHNYYFLYDVIPDESLTGGIFYNDSGLDIELIEILRIMCIKKVKIDYDNAKQSHSTLDMKYKESLTSLTDILKYIRDTKVINGDISEIHIKKIMDILCSENIVKNEEDDVTQYRYKPDLSGI